MFLPKSGDNKESIRNIVRSITRQFCSVYPASKLFTFLLANLNSKNSRTRAEGMDEMANLIQRHGMNVIPSPQRVFPLIAKQMGERDATVRNSAINVVLQAYLIVGDLDLLYKYLGPMSTKDKALLDEKVIIISFFFFLY